MQVVYSEKNIDLNYLNNYVNYFIKEDYLYLYNTVFNKKVVLRGLNKNLNELLIYLRNGVDYNQLITILGKISDKPKILYEYLLQNFIIE